MKETEFIKEDEENMIKLDYLYLIKLVQND